MLSEQMKKLTLLRAAMLKTKADGLNINPPAMTRTDYDKTRGMVFGVPVEIQNWMGTGGMFQRPGYPSPSEPGGLTIRKIILGPDIKPGVATHELEHNLTQILGEIIPQDIQQWSGELLYNEATDRINPSAVKTLLRKIKPHDSEIFPEWQGYKPAMSYMENPAEFSRAAVRLFNHSNPQNKSMVAELLPSLYEKLQLIPEEILRLLTPHTIAGVKKYDSPGIIM